jgi:hypothetical protein
MALGTEEATFNAAVDTLMAAWETMVDALDANEVTRIVWVASRYGDNASDTAQGSDATAVFQFARQYYWANNPDTASDSPFEIGGHPLFFKVTNASGDLT